MHTRGIGFSALVFAVAATLSGCSLLSGDIVFPTTPEGDGPPKGTECVETASVAEYSLDAPTFSDYISYEPIADDTDQLVSKFGGQPAWLEEPQWPVSYARGTQMEFIAQIALEPELFPGSESQMAYVFATNNFMSDAMIVATWDPSMGESAVILQPGGVPLVEVTNEPTGPSVSDEAGSAYLAQGTRQVDPAFTPEAEKSGWTAEQWAAEDPLFADKIGGTPKFLQSDEFPLCGAASTLILQFSKELINLGDGGTAYAFMNREGTKGGFLTQSH